MVAIMPHSHMRPGVLRRVRRRTWAAIMLCLVCRFGDAALHAHTPDTLSDPSPALPVTKPSEKCHEY